MSCKKDKYYVMQKGQVLYHVKRTSIMSCKKDKCYVMQKGQVLYNSKRACDYVIQNRLVLSC